MSPLRCDSCGFQPYKPASNYGEVTRDALKHWHFLCAECSGIEPPKPLTGIRAELALHFLLIARRRIDLGDCAWLDDWEEYAIEKNTLIAWRNPR